MLFGALKHELDPLRSKMGPLSLIFLLFMILGPSQKVMNQIRVVLDS